jgi:hypothetical protein
VLDSYRKTDIGSTREARRAGRYPASSASAARKSVAAPTVDGANAVPANGCLVTRSVGPIRNGSQKINRRSINRVCPGASNPSGECREECLFPVFSLDKSLSWMPHSAALVANESSAGWRADGNRRGATNDDLVVQRGLAENRFLRSRLRSGRRGRRRNQDV